MKQTTVQIGVIEQVSLLDDKLENVPAKIDTGADSSAIWATRISEAGGRLTFVLFDKTAPYYTGNVLNTNDYQTVSIKNSFGQTERRYKVTLKLRLGGRLIKARFTLADRSKNRYPILIGRQTLAGKFVVNPACKLLPPDRQASKAKREGLMLSTKYTAVTREFANNVSRSAQTLDITYATYEDIRFVINEDGVTISLTDSGRDVASFDMVHFKTSARHKDIAAAIARYAEAHGVPFISQSIRNYSDTSKIYQYVILSNEGGSLTIPPSVFLLPPQLAHSYDFLKQQLGLPFVLKDIHGKKGEYNYLIKSKALFDATVQRVATDEVRCIAQAYIPNDGDYRVLVLGARIALVIHRVRLSDKTHLNNTSQGGQATLMPLTSLPADIRAACLRAAELMENQVAGVDIVQDKQSGLWYCLEVNNDPQLATGSFTAEKHAAFAAYLTRKLT